MTNDDFHFDSTEAFLAECTQPTKVTKPAEAPSNTFGIRYGTETFEDAVRLARNGWPEGLAMLSAMRDLITAPEGIASLVPCPMIADDGDEVLIDRYLDGESDCWLSFPQQITPQRGKVVAVSVHVSGGGHLDSSAWTARGAAAICLIDALESAGYRVELRITGRSSTGDRTFNFSAILKRAEDPLDLDRIAFFLMQVAVQRRFLFRLRERTAAPKQWVTAKMGYSRNLDPEEIPEGEIHFQIPAGSLTISGAAALAREKLDAYLAAIPA